MATRQADNEDENLPAETTRTSDGESDIISTRRERDTRSDAYKFPKRATATVAGGTIGGGILYLLAKNTDWAAWSNFFLDCMKQFLEKNGPAPVLLVLCIFVFVGLMMGMQKQVVDAKNSEIERLVTERDRLQELLNAKHPTSSSGIGAKRDSKKK